MKEQLKSLLGKTINYYDGFSGIHSYLKINLIESYPTYLMVYPESMYEKWACGIVIPKQHLSELLHNGSVEVSNTIEGCTFYDSWILS